MSGYAEGRTLNAEWKIRENFGKIKGVLESIVWTFGKIGVRNFNSAKTHQALERVCIYWRN